MARVGTWPVRYGSGAASLPPGALSCVARAAEPALAGRLRGPVQPQWLLESAMEAFSLGLRALPHSVALTRTHRALIVTEELGKLA